MEEREGPRLKKRDPKSHLNDGIRAENESELKEQERRAVDQNLVWHGRRPIPGSGAYQLYDF